MGFEEKEMEKYTEQKNLEGKKWKEKDIEKMDFEEEGEKGRRIIILK